jgi:hypothetical protein
MSTIQWILVASQICATVAMIDFRIFSSLLTEIPHLLVVIPQYLQPQTPQNEAATNLLSARIDLSILNTHTWNYLLCGLLWLTLCTVSVLRFFLLLNNFFERMYHISFMCSSVDGHLVLFPSLCLFTEVWNSCHQVLLVEMVMSSVVLLANLFPSRK